MREEPKAGAKLVDQYTNGTQVEVLEVSGEWVKVCINCKIGYMMVKFLEGDLPEANENTQENERPELPDNQNGEWPEMPGAPGGMGGPGGENAPTDYSAANTVTESSTGANYTSTGSSENAVLVSTAWLWPCKQAPSIGAGAASRSFPIILKERRKAP